jgi:hypothetical protein
VSAGPEQSEIVVGARRSLSAARIALRHSLARHDAAVSALQGCRRAWKMSSFAVRARAYDLTSGDPYLHSGRLFLCPTSSLRHRTALVYGYDPGCRPGAVIGGDWDVVDGTIEDSQYWTEFREALQGRRPWCETRLHARLVEKAAAENVPWRRRILLRDLDYLLDGYERLYASMAVSGCLPQRRLTRERGPAYRPVNTDDISVAVGRTGELLLCQGGHRVEAARALGIKEVPVWIGVRHTQWWAFRRAVVAYALGHGGRVPERLLHPDLETIPYVWDPSSLLPALRRVLADECGIVVDASPGWGTLLHLLEDEGLPCVAIAEDVGERRFLGRLRDAGEKRFMIAASAGEVPAGKDGAALLLLRGVEERLGTSDGRDEILSLLARLRPWHVLLGGAAGSRARGPSSAAVRFFADAAGLSQVEVLEGGETVHLFVESTAWRERVPDADSGRR